MTDEVADQAQEQSAMEKLGAKFGFPSDANPDDMPAPEVQAAPPDLFDLTIEGELFQVPAKLKDAFMRTEDYTKKTQELGEQRRAVDQVRGLLETRQMDAAFSQSVSAEQQELAVIDAYLSQISKTDLSQLPTDQLLRQKLEIDNVKERKAALQSSIEGKRAQFQTEVKNKLAELRGKSKEAASKAIPGFNEETDKAVRAFALAEGLTEAELDNVLMDPRSYKILWKAQQFDAVQAATKKVDGKVDKVLKVGAATERMPQEVRNKLEFGRNMKKAVTSTEKAALIEQRLAGGMFSRGK